MKTHEFGKFCELREVYWQNKRHRTPCWKWILRLRCKNYSTAYGVMRMYANNWRAYTEQPIDIDFEVE